MSKIKVRRSQFNALNEWYANGSTGMELLRSYITCQDNGLSFKEPYQAFANLDENTIIKIASVGPKGYELELTSDELLLERWEAADTEERETILWVLETTDYLVKGINF